MRSTTGVFLCLAGSRTFCPLAGVLQKQTAVSHSTPEAEIVAADFGLRTEGIPAMQLWDNLTGRQITLEILEDNSAALQVMQNR